MSYDNIPNELKELRQWVVSWNDKVPRDPKTGLKAKVTDAKTWGTFEQAVHAKAEKIGFVLTPWDPYTIIDLDDKEDNPCTEEQRQLHLKILKTAKSYTERSTSGRGYHIVVKGSVAAALHRDNVEVYSHSRYMIFTGDTQGYNLPIEDRQFILDDMYKFMVKESTRTEHVDEDEVLTDTQIVEMASEAINGDKFDALCRGDWEDLYSSQSEADLALVAMLTYYSPNDEQVRRLFRMTALAERDKAIRNDKYINYTINRARSTQQSHEPVEIKEIPMNLQVSTPTPQVKTVPAPVIELANENFKFPSGLVGEIAQYIYDTAQRPIKKIALAGALALVGGIAGRAYNYSNTGLNQYLVICADTGSGKEDASKGIDRIIDSIASQIPAAEMFAGPANFASGQAVIRYLDKHPSFVSVMGEFGITLSRITDPRANGADKTFHKVLLDLYSKSGWNQFLRPSVYADSEKNTTGIKAPNFTILGDTTPETFYDRLTSDNVSDGLLPRFLIFNYKGKRVPRNKNAGAPPSEFLVDKVKNLATIALDSYNNNKYIQVGCEPDAQAFLDQFDIFSDNQINSDSANVVSKQLWNRAHLKALKVSALLAVGMNLYKPIITKDLAVYAVNLVNEDIAEMLECFNSGLMASSNTQRETKLKEIIEAYEDLDLRARFSFKVPSNIASKNVVPYCYLVKKVRGLKVFEDDRGIDMLAITLKNLCKSGEITQVPPSQLANMGYKGKMECYVMSDEFT